MALAIAIGYIESNKERLGVTDADVEGIKKQQKRVGAKHSLHILALQQKELENRIEAEFGREWLEQNRQKAEQAKATGVWG